jgi:pilus assembly protein CpaF
VTTASRDRLVGAVLLPLLTEIDFTRLQEAHVAELRKLCVERLELHAPEGSALRSLGGRRELTRLGGDLGAVLISCRSFFALLQADDVGEVLVNGPHRVQVERGGQRIDVDAAFPATEVLLQVARWLTAGIGRRATAQNPVVDGRLPDGSRISVVMPPVAVDGPVISIRWSRHLSYELEGLAALDMFPPPVVGLLRAAVIARLNILVSGAPGSGRTTLLGALARCGNPAERIATIEEAAELRLARPHVLRLERGGGSSLRELLQTAIAMRPDRLIVGELSGPEAGTLIQAMSAGFSGSLAAIQAASTRDAIERLEASMAAGAPGLSERVLRRQIGRSLDLIVHLKRLCDGRRVLSSLCEVGSGDPIKLKEIIRFDEHSEGPAGRSRGTFAATGTRPAMLKRLERRGLRLPAELWKLQHAVA